MRLLLLFAVSFRLGAVSLLNSPTVDPSQFRVTQFASAQSYPTSMIQAADGSLLALVSPGFNNAQVVRYTDTNLDGISDGPPTVLYSNAQAGPATQIRQAGKFLYIGEFGANSITALTPGATPADPLAAAGSLQFQYAGNYLHPTIGMAVRPTPGTPGSVDLVFNVGSQYNNQTSTSPVTIRGWGLGATQLQGDSLYMVTIDESGATPVASNLRTVATGIRNVYGMGFHPVTGDFYFADNAIDEANVTTTSEPVQADELNRIPAAVLGVTPLNFGYPNCYPQYRTNTLIETSPGACTGVTQSLINFQPVPNTPSGFRTEGPTELAFAPANFPVAYRNGLFVGFSGGQGPGGINNQNGLVFVNSTQSLLLHFIESGTLPSSSVLGVYATADSLFVADFGGGSIYEITALGDIPEPATWILGLPALAVVSRRRIGESFRRVLHSNS